MKYGFVFKRGQLSETSYEIYEKENHSKTFEVGLLNFATKSEVDRKFDLFA